jgi:hypothetical protein
VDQVQTVLPLDRPNTPQAPRARLLDGLEPGALDDRVVLPPVEGRRTSTLGALALFVIVIASFALQAQVVRLTAGFTQSALLLTSVLLEFGLIGALSHW